jgi:hypothetical protein
MNMKLKTMTAMMVMVTAAALLTATVAKADSNPLNDSDVFTVRLTPNVDLGVIVDTSGSNWAGSGNLDVTMDLGADHVLDNPVYVEMAGNFNNQELALTGANLNTWVLDTDEIDVTDQMRLYGMFGLLPFNTAQPVAADFDGTNNLITTSQKRAGQPQANEAGNTNHTFEFSTGHDEYVDVDGMSPADVRALWLRATTPGTSTSDLQAAFTVTVTAVTGAGL